MVPVLSSTSRWPNGYCLSCSNERLNPVDETWINKRGGVYCWNLVLPKRRELSYPRCVKPRPPKNSVKKANKKMPVRLN
ncbi:hypothetical protein CF119_11865 [Aeromonas sobria]|nr:hypothetical protein CF119_11865 [Aeromonas sobria]